MNSLLNVGTRSSVLGEQAQTAIDYAFKWLGADNHDVNMDAGFVLNALLGRTDLGERAQTAIDYAFKWLGANGTTPEAKFLCKRILRKRDLSELDWKRVAAIALGNLEITPNDQPDRDFTIYSLLARPAQLTPENRERLAKHSLNWLGAHGGEKRAERMPAALRKMRRALGKEHPLFGEITRVMKTLQFHDEADRAYFRSLVQTLNRAARDTASMVDVALLEEGCIEMQSKAGLLPAVAAHAIPPLLVLGSRFGDSSLYEVKVAVASVLADERLTDFNRQGLLNACRRLVEAGAFASRDAAMALLEELGLLEFPEKVVKP